MTEIISWSAVDTANNLRRKTVSVREVTEAHLARLNKINPQLNVITEVVEDSLELADAMDAAHPGDAAPALWGVPITTKTNTDQIGFANSNGVRAFKDNICSEDASVIANLKSAGAVIIGRSNTPEFSIRWCSSNPLHGVSLNPWDSNATPGGSSGGAAAAVAAGIGALAHGNDMGGSLRYPAFCCGVASIRPSMGRVPAFNPSATVERPPITYMMSVQGPIARSVGDLRLGLNAMATRSSSDPLWTSAPDSGRTRSSKIRVGYSMSPFSVDMSDPAIATAMQTALDGLRDAGVETVEMPFPGADRAATLWGQLMFTETEILMGDTIRQFGSEDIQQLCDTYGERFGSLSFAEFLAGMGERTALQRQVARMFDDIDLFLMPTSLLRPFENDLDYKTPEAVPQILDAQKPLFAINLLGLPAVAIPTNIVDGLPVGVQLIGAMHDDAFALDVAEMLEQQIGRIVQQLAL